jgi:hypothetical protein
MVRRVRLRSLDQNDPLFEKRSVCVRLPGDLEQYRLDTAAGIPDISECVWRLGRGWR